MLGGKNFRIKRIHIHPKYNPNYIYDVVNDVAILKLKTLIPFSKSVSAIPLIVDTKPGFGTAITALGWGRREDGSTSCTF
jgi:hypothetical protein